MDCPDCFPWATLFGVIGTLLGTAVGGLLAHRHAEKQATEDREYRDRTRFHNDRLAAYAEFVGAQSDYQSLALFAHDASPGGGETARLRTDALGKFTTTFSRAKLLASEPVEKLAGDLYIATSELARNGRGKDDRNLAATIAISNRLEEAMKRELNIQPPPSAPRGIAKK